MNSKPWSTNTKKHLKSLWLKALIDTDVDRAVRKHLQNVKWKKLRLVSIGKSSMPMANTAHRVLKGRIAEALLISPRHHTKNSLPKTFKILRSDHPIPTRKSLAAGMQLKRFVQSESPLPLLFLISGGASALAVVPQKGITLQRKLRTILRLYRSGVPIQKLNRERTKLSAIKGGKLLRGVKAPSLSLIISDVIGDPLHTIASGLTVPPKRKKNVHNILILPISSAAKQLCQLLRQRGLRTYLEKKPLQGEAYPAGVAWGKKLLKLSGHFDAAVAFGETTVRVRGKGLGGRCLEFSMGVAKSIRGRRSISSLVGSTDGLDGNSMVAGAFVNEKTWERGLHLRPDEILRDNNSGAYFKALHDFFKPGPTGKNFADLSLILF